MTALAIVCILSALAVCEARADDIVLGGAVGSKAQVQINKASANPASRSIKYVAKDPAILFTPGSGAIDDPLVNGAAAVIFSATDCQCIAMDNEPTVTPGWTPTPSIGPPKKYKWKDLITKSTAQVSAGKIKLKKKNGIAYGLDASPQGEVEVQITFGNSTGRFCTRFSAPAATNDTATKYKSNVVAPGFGPDCSTVPDICPCAPSTTTTSTSSSTTATTSSTTSSTSSSSTSSTSSSSTSSTSSSTTTSTSSSTTTSTTIAPDLTPTNLTIPGSATTNTSISVSWTIENAGSGAATPNWDDQIYFSTDAVLDNGDTQIGGKLRTVALGAGASYSDTASASIPNVAPGSYYILLKTDATGNLAESDETNNLIAMPITITP
jgi:hypothetical protein